MRRPAPQPAAPSPSRHARARRGRQRGLVKDRAGPSCTLNIAQRKRTGLRDGLATAKNPAAAVGASASRSSPPPPCIRCPGTLDTRPHGAPSMLRPAGAGDGAAAVSGAGAGAGAAAAETPGSTPTGPGPRSLVRNAVAAWGPPLVNGGAGPRPCCLLDGGSVRGLHLRWIGEPRPSGGARRWVQCRPSVPPSFAALAT